MTKLQHDLYKQEFPLSNRYEPDWIMDNQMGPNALWLAEWLLTKLDLTPDMRVLDLGCGTAMSSIFLAKETGVRVWAADLWVDPDENWKRIRDTRTDDLVCPMKAEAHALPFAEGFFDAIVSLDAYQYFGTDELYLSYISRFVRPDGIMAMVVPAWMKDFGTGVPQHMTKKQSHGEPFWGDDMVCFHTVDWWRALWERSNLVTVTVADTMPDGWKHWRDFEIALERAGKNRFPSVAEALEADQGDYIGFARVVALRNSSDPPMNYYDSSLMARVETGTVSQ
jgi:SAM-dependent methyltransferase